ncbi:MAG: methylated-DNA--[protein]-cysteine S-methyltransferase [Legionellales bacterium]|nr:methylated-DNA--[protein]-cysteine S-methyltransferase [Legionellales bacterium]
MAQPSFETVTIDSLVGRLAITACDDQIVGCDWATYSAATKPTAPVLQQAVAQLTEYFNGERTTFTLPLAPTGTPFQQTVWQTLQTIPYGITWSYQQLAQAIGNSNASRAVGSANGKNPISIIIPCHRVIRASGNLGGYAGGLDKKTRLLTLEGCTSFSNNDDG